MEHIYAVKSTAELMKYQSFVDEMRLPLDAYIQQLKQDFAVLELPRAIVWTSAQTAMHEISDLPIPAYTNDYRVVITPDLNAWRNIYLRQLNGLPEDSVSDIREYYTHALNHHHILQILGHELAHHSELFFDEAYDSGKGVWFEEGMAEYISRRFFFTESEFDQERNINRRLVNLFEQRNGIRPLDDFSVSTYQSDYFSIFYAYWRSFLAVDQIATEYHNNLSAVFRSYCKWFESGCSMTLAQWFELEP